MVNRPNSITGCPNWSGMSVHCSCMRVLGRESEALQENSCLSGFLRLGALGRTEPP